MAGRVVAGQTDAAATLAWRVACGLVRAMSVAALLLLGAGRVSQAADPPPGMTKDQFDTLVGAVAETLSKTLAAPSDAQKPAQPDEIDAFARTVGELVQRAPGVVAAVPSLPERTADALAALGGSAGGLTEGAFLRTLATVLAAAAAAQIALAVVSRGLARRLARRRGSPARMGAVLGAAAAEFAKPIVVWIVTRIGLGLLLTASPRQLAFGVSVLDAAAGFSLVLAILQVWLRPGWEAARIAPVDDRDAASLRWKIAAVFALILTSRLWLSLLSDPDSVSAALLVNAMLVGAAYLWLAWSGRAAFGDWLAGLKEADPARSGRARGRQAWLAVAFPLAGFSLLMRLYAALAGRPEIPRGTIVTIATLLGLLLGETLIRWILRHPQAASARHGVEARLLRAAARLTRVLMLLVAASVLARAWAVDALRLVREAEWPAVSHHWWLAGFVVLLSFIAGEAVRFVTNPYIRAGKAGMADPVGPGAGSRARTLAPLLRAALLVVIATLGTLAALSILGVSITPIIAGASIVGLAISFGSQTLVQDIVAGIFYLAEDAFRVGEYIECGSSMGTVEGFALRSLRLRHENGQLQTIPFGQLGRVTNFSRDWSTVKFNLRFGRDVDLDELRSAAREVGQTLADDPAYAGDFLEPMKMQGVVDVLDDAIVVRFKFTVRPVRPGQIQREATLRLLRELPRRGIQPGGKAGPGGRASVPAEPDRVSG
jgi:small-conductance mechanosensitive channel